MQAKASPAARLLIVDDHALVREGMRTMLASEPGLEIIGEAANGREALELCRRLCPDLVLMDVRMPEMDGLEATRAIKEQCPNTSVLMVTSHESQDYLLSAIRAGAAGYILKEATRREVLDSVRGVLNGEPTLDRELVMRLLRRVADEPNRQPPPEPASERHEPPPGPQPEESLSAKELEVVRLFAAGKSNREIAQSMRVSLSSVKTYVQRVIKKLGVSDRTQASVRAVELGLISPKR